MRKLIYISSFFLSSIAISQNSQKFTFDSNKSYSDKEIDSILKNFRPNPLNMLELNKLLQVSHNKKVYQYYYFIRGIQLFRTDVTDSVAYYIDKSISIYKESDEKSKLSIEYLIDSYVIKATIESNLKNNFEESILLYQIALDYSKDITYPKKSSILMGIAENHYKMGSDNLAIEYLLKSSKDTSYVRNPNLAIPMYGKIASLYYNLGDVKNAKKFCRKGIRTSYQYRNMVNLSAFYGFLGVLNFDKKEIDSATYYINKAYDINKEYGVARYDGAEETNEFYKGYINVFGGSINEGIQTLNNLIAKLDQVEKPTKDHRDLFIRSLQVLSNAYEKQNNSKEYVMIIQKTVAFLDKFHKLHLQENLNQLEVKYETKEKDLFITQLQKSKEQQKTIIGQQRIIAIILGALLLLLLGLGLTVWRQMKLKVKFEKGNLEQRLLRLQMNPHFIGNAMNTINALVEKKSVEVVAYVNNLSRLFRLILINSREEFISLSDELATIESYLTLQSNFSKKFDFTICVSKEIDQETIVVPPMLIQPLIENAINHGLIDKTDGVLHIKINKSKRHDMLICKIRDNGKGYSENENKGESKPTSISGDIIRERIKILKSKFELDLKLTIEKIDDKGGTEASLYLPYLID